VVFLGEQSIKGEYPDLSLKVIPLRTERGHPQFQVNIFITSEKYKTKPGLLLFSFWISCA
jgi:hypothetical protein